MTSSCPPANYRVLGPEALGERVATNEVGAQGETFPFLLLKQLLQIFCNLFFESSGFFAQGSKFGVEPQHFGFELILGHAVVFDYNSYVTAGVEGIILVADAVFAFYAGGFAEAYYIGVGSVWKAFGEPVYLCLPVGFCFYFFVIATLRGAFKGGGVFCYEIFEGLYVAIVETGDDSKIFYLFVVELSVSAVYLGKD